MNLSLAAIISTVIVAAIAGLPPTLLAWSSLIQSRKNAVKSDTLIEKTDKIHELTDGHLSKVTDELKAANDRINGLEVLLKDLVHPSVPIDAKIAELKNPPSPIVKEDKK